MLHEEWSIVAHNRVVQKQCNIDGQRSASLVDMEVFL